MGRNIVAALHPSYELKSGHDDGEIVRATKRGGIPRRNFNIPLSLFSDSAPIRHTVFVAVPSHRESLE